MNFVKFLRTTFLQNTFGRLLLKIYFWSRSEYNSEAIFAECSSFSASLVPHFLERFTPHKETIARVFQAKIKENIYEYNTL